MPTLNELRETFFSDRPVTQIFFGEPTERRIMDVVLRKGKIDPIDAASLEDAAVQKVAAGTYPVLIQSYDDFRFDTIVPEDLLREYLREHLDRPDPRMWASFTEHDALAGIVQRFMMHIGKRPFKAVEAGPNLKFYFFANIGERLVIATLGRVPVPGEPIIA